MPSTASQLADGELAEKLCSAQSHDLKTSLTGQIARALAVFCVDEVVIFDDGQGKQQKNGYGGHQQYESGEGSYTGYSDPNHFLMHLLSYLETPPHLRKHLFPMHPDLRTAGSLPSLDMPHHLRAYEWCQYREGVTIESLAQSTPRGPTVIEEKGKTGKKRKLSLDTASATTQVDAGFPQKITIPTSVAPNTRVTLKFPTASAPPNLQSFDAVAEAVAPSIPREEAGYYWGYTVRPAASLSTIFTESPYDGGYDLTMGTSERGSPLSSLTSPSSVVPEFRHMLLVFGGVAGLEVAAKADEELTGMGVAKPEELFDYWINLVEGQGSRTIRTEEAVWLGLMGLREVVTSKGKR